MDKDTLISELEGLEDIDDVRGTGRFAEVRKNNVVVAQALLRGAIELLEEADLGENTKAYVIDHLKIMAGEGHGFLSSDKNLDDVLRGIEEEHQENLADAKAAADELEADDQAARDEEESNG